MVVGSWLSRRQRGIIIVTVGITWVSPDSLLVRLAEEEHDVECIVFYKYFFKFWASLIGMCCVYGGPRGFLREAKAGGYHFWLASLSEGITEAMFTLGVIYTTAANNLVLVSANPLWCALFSFIFFRERPPPHTLAALLIGFGCIVLIVFGTGSDGDTPSGRETLKGDLFAFGTGIMSALHLTTCRHAGIVRPNASLVPASSLSAVVSILVGFFQAEGNVGSRCAPRSGFVGWLPLAVNGAVILPVALACFSTGPKYIMSSEAGLIMLLEVILGPVFVWLAVQESPSSWTLIGGTLLLVVLAFHETFSLYLETKAGKASAAEEIPDDVVVDAAVGNGATEKDLSVDTGSTCESLEDGRKPLSVVENSRTIMSI